MIDENDGDFFVLLGQNGGCLWTLICLVIALVLYYVGYQNAYECEGRTCPTNQVAKLIDHECICTEQPK